MVAQGVMHSYYSHASCESQVVFDPLSTFSATVCSRVPQASWPCASVTKRYYEKYENEKNEIVAQLLAPTAQPLHSLCRKQKHTQYSHNTQAILAPRWYLNGVVPSSHIAHERSKTKPSSREPFRARHRKSPTCGR